MEKFHFTGSTSHGFETSTDAVNFYCAHVWPDLFSIEIKSKGRSKYRYVHKFG